jgi:hypothetical protein
MGQSGVRQTTNRKNTEREKEGNSTLILIAKLLYLSEIGNQNH